MNRREAVKWAGAALIGAVGGTAIGCKKQDVIQLSETAIAYLEQVLPLFTELLPSSAPTIRKGIEVCKLLQVALKSSSADTLDLIQQLLGPGGLMSQIIDSLALVTDPDRRRELTVALMIAEAALVGIATALGHNVPAPIVAKARLSNKSGVEFVEKIAKSDAIEKALKALR